MSKLHESMKLNKAQIEEMMARSSINRHLNLAKLVQERDARLNVSSVEELEEKEYKVELDNNNGKLTVKEDDDNE